MLKIGRFTLTPLNGGLTHMDGGAMFGVVPKALWRRKYPSNEHNQLPLVCYPILIQSDREIMLIDSGLGNGKLTEKQRRNYGVTDESHVESELTKLGLTLRDIDVVLMTHMHFDHALGLTTADEKSVFKRARIITSSVEWAEMQQPNIRSRATYWEKNYQGIEQQIETFDRRIDVCPGITMQHTGGHSDGHSIIVIEDEGERAVHMADILPTTAHFNPLWVTAYDDYPIESIKAKQQLLQQYGEDWMLFYHDIHYFAVKRHGDDINNAIRRGEINV